MTMSYLALPHLHVQQANIYNAAFLIGGPPVLAAWLMAHALGRALKLEDSVKSMVFVLHDMEPLGERSNYEFNPQQRRGAAFTFTKSNNSDYSGNSLSLSLQPVACAHMEVSLVIGINDVLGSGEVDTAAQWLHSGRLAGGLVTGMGKPKVFEDLDEALNRGIRTGYIVMDRRDLMESGEGNRAEKFVAALGHKPTEGDGMGWLSATCLGYAAITPFEQRAGAREGYPHAFAEPLVGLVQYRSLRDILEKDEAKRTLWRPEWISTDASNLAAFRIYQKLP